MPKNLLPPPCADITGSLRERIAGSAGAALIGLLGSTWRWENPGKIEEEGGIPTDGTPRILVGWHSQQLLLQSGIRYFREQGWNKRITALISQSSDGRMVAEAMRRLGFSSIAGSSSKGGTEALFSLARVLRDGLDVFITPDGPRGPACVAKVGACMLSKRTGFPIVPIAARAEYEWRFGSWDRMILGRFAATTVFSGGPAIYPADSESLREMLGRMQQGMDSLNVRIEQKLGKQPDAVLLRAKKAGEA